MLGGHDTTAATRKQRAALRNDFIGFVFQFHYLLPEFSVLENVLMPGRIAGAPQSELVTRAEENLALLGLEGLEKKNANDLSGGQKQRVAIARALMNRPALVLADEPTGNLDTVNTKAVYKLFREINQELGTAFVIVTHDRSVAQQTDRILEISDGALLQDVRNEYAGPRREAGTCRHGGRGAGARLRPRGACERPCRAGRRGCDAGPALVLFFLVDCVVGVAACPALQARDTW